MAENKKLWVSVDGSESGTANVWDTQPVWDFDLDMFTGSPQTRIGCVGIQVLSALCPNLHLPEPGQVIEIPASDERDELIERLVGALDEMQDLMNSSSGVAGFHLNGDIASWDQCAQTQMIADALAAAREQGYGAKKDGKEH